jgi:hypothetical protein
MLDQVISLKYLLSGLSVIFGALGFYGFSLVMRWRKLKQKFNLLNDEEDRPESEEIQ